jgi:hypothetical protein
VAVVVLTGKRSNNLALALIQSLPQLSHFIGVEFLIGRKLLLKPQQAPGKVSQLNHNKTSSALLKKHRVKKNGVTSA